MKEIIVASGNKGKIKEIEQILNDYKVIPIKDLNINIDVEENGKTFEENAIIKAEFIAKTINKLCIADDSGIEILSLNGFPGVKTKRWFDGTDRQRNLAIIDKVERFKKKEQRKIRFRTAIALSDGINTICEVADINGYVSKEPRGENGFGFDEIFELENGKTLAQLSEKEKNSISSRKIAIENIKKRMKEF